MSIPRKKVSSIIFVEKIEVTLDNPLPFNENLYQLRIRVGGNLHGGMDLPKKEAVELYESIKKEIDGVCDFEERSKPHGQYFSDGVVDYMFEDESGNSQNRQMTADDTQEFFAKVEELKSFIYKKLDKHYFGLEGE